MLPKRILFWLGPLLIGGLFVCFATLLYPPLHARYLQYELRDIQVNRSTFEDAQKFAKRIGAQEAAYFDPEKCRAQVECRWYKSTDNALLPQWYRDKGVTFTIFFTAKNSIVTNIGVEYAVGVAPWIPAEAFVGRPNVYVAQLDSWIEGEKQKQRFFQEERHEKPIDLVEPTLKKGWSKIWYDKDGNITVDSFAVSISPESKSMLEDWKKYTAFNYSCFWKYKGCRHGKDLLSIADPYPPQTTPNPHR